MITLYEKIGETKIKKAITDFYVRAFKDPLISHFFYKRDLEKITNQQIDFSIGLLGGPKNYSGRPLDRAHAELGIRKPHFDRRQMLFREVLEANQIEAAHVDEWLAMEESLRILVVKLQNACIEAKVQTV